MKVDAILMADIHLRETTPECRTDDFVEAMRRKLDYVWELQNNYNCPVLIAGDLFHHWKSTPYLLGLAINYLPESIIAIPGQHDLPAHNIEQIHKSSINVLSAAGIIKVLTLTRGNPQRIATDKFLVCGFPWGVELTGRKTISEKRTIALVHSLVYKGKEPFPGAKECGNTAKALMNKMKGFDLIVTGDNHQTFTERIGDRLLVNPGSMMRTTAAQIDHKPSVFLWNAEYNEVEQVFLPIQEDVISREHIDIVAERDERIDSFVSRLNHHIELTMSFEENMKEYLATNSISKSVKNIIWEELNG